MQVKSAKPATLLSLINHYRRSTEFRYICEESMDVMACFSKDMAHCRFFWRLLKYSHSDRTCITTMADKIGRGRQTVFRLGNQIREGRIRTPGNTGGRLCKSNHHPTRAGNGYGIRGSHEAAGHRTG